MSLECAGLSPFPVVVSQGSCLSDTCTPSLHGTKRCGVLPRRSTHIAIPTKPSVPRPRPAPAPHTPPLSTKPHARETQRPAAIGRATTNEMGPPRGDLCPRCGRPGDCQTKSRSLALQPFTPDTATIQTAPIFGDLADRSENHSFWKAFTAVADRREPQ